MHERVHDIKPTDHIEIGHNYQEIILIFNLI